jgi:hypothetical protein
MRNGTKTAEMDEKCTWRWSNGCECRKDVTWLDMEEKGMWNGSKWMSRDVERNKMDERWTGNG